MHQIGIPKSGVLGFKPALGSILLRITTFVLIVTKSLRILLKMNEPAIDSHRSVEKVEVSVRLDSQLLEEIQHLTNDPSKIIETALRQWLRGETQRDDELTRSLVRNPPVPPRGEWND